MNIKQLEVLFGKLSHSDFIGYYYKTDIIWHASLNLNRGVHRGVLTSADICLEGELFILDRTTPSKKRAILYPFYSSILTRSKKVE